MESGGFPSHPSFLGKRRQVGPDQQRDRHRLQRRRQALKSLSSQSITVDMWLGNASWNDRPLCQQSEKRWLGAIESRQGVGARKNRTPLLAV